MGYAIATRLHCSVCGAEVLITQPGSGIIRCCDTEMASGAADSALSPTEEAANGD